MRLSVLIVNWNTTSYLSALLDSLARHAPPFEHETIVVDNASEDLDQAAFRAGYLDVKLIANDHNAGYAAANNQAINAAAGEHLLLLNPDTEAAEGALAKLVDFMAAHPKAAAAGAKLVRPDGTVDRSVRGFPYPWPIACELLGLSRLCRCFGSYRTTGFTYDKAAQVDQPMGSCLILRREAVNDVGLFDEQFPIFFNEVDWLYRAKQKGWEVYFTPDAVFVHHGAASTRQVDRRRMIRESHESLIRFYAKHFKGKMPAAAYYFVIACIRMGRFVRG